MHALIVCKLKWMNEKKKNKFIPFILEIEWYDLQVAERVQPNGGKRTATVSETAAE